MNLLYIELLASHIQNRLKIENTSNITLDKDKGKIFIDNVDLTEIDSKFWEFNGEILVMANSKIAINSPLPSYSIQFRNCKFGLINISTKKILMHFVFIDCTFQNRLIARQTTFFNRLEFEACEFFEDIDFGGICSNNLFLFRNNKVKKNARFIKSHFYHKVDFSESYFYNQCIFEQTVFYQRLMFNVATLCGYSRFVDVRFCGVVNFFGTVFSRADFTCAFFEKAANFIMVIFEEDAIFWLSKFHSVARFSRVSFQKTAIFNDVDFRKSIPHHTEALNYHNKKGKYNLVRFVTQIDFSSAMFYDIFEMQRAKINGLINFSNASFKKDTKWSKTHFFHSPIFKETIFGVFSVWQGVTFDKDIKFDSIDFRGKVSFAPFKKENPTMFKADATFHNCIFEESDFSRVDFKGIAKFDGVIFKDLASFYKTHFSQEANFQGSIFGGITSFDETKFSLSQKPNFLNCTFSNQLNIEHKYLKLEYGEIENKDNPSLWRDLFRRLKSNRIAHHNVIDASELHAQELYARELELKKEAKTIREKIEKWQLWFYRKTSDHHTDLLRAFNSLLCLVFVFGVLSFGAMIWFACYFDKTSSISSLFDMRYLQVIYNSHISLLIHKHPYYTFGINFSFIAIFLSLFLISVSKYSGHFFVFLGYVTSIVLFLISPKLLMPAIGFFTDKREVLDPLSIIGGIYTLLFGFLAYSFIKTARKNSIIPS